MRSLAFIFREFLSSLACNRFLHFTYGLQVAISLLVLGIFIVGLAGGTQLWLSLGRRMVVKVFVVTGTPPLRLNAMEEELSEIPHVTGVALYSKEQAIDDFFKKHPGIDIEDILDNNPLPDSFVVTLDRPANTKQVAAACENINDVLKVSYPSELVDRYQNILIILIAICLATISILLIFTYSSINNIISLSIYSRRAEIRIMQLVGATWSFIRWPFLFEGLFIGTTGAIVALLIIWLLMAAMGEALRLSELLEAMPWLGTGGISVYLWIAVVLVCLGGGIGFFGSLKTVNRFLGRETEILHEASKVRHLLR